MRLSHPAGPRKEFSCDRRRFRAPSPSCWRGGIAVANTGPRWSSGAPAALPQAHVGRVWDPFLAEFRADRQGRVVRYTRYGAFHRCDACIPRVGRADPSAPRRMSHGLALLVVLGVAARGGAVPFAVAVGRPQPRPAAAESSQVFREDFRAGWKDRWTERALSRRRTRYEVVQEDGRRVLKATSNRSASALWHKLGIRLGAKGRISWRWKVQTSLSQNEHEREKRGDDYAARLFVVFDADLVSPHTHAICYVWAAHEVVGAVYSSPYTNGVATIVIESGDQRAKQWVAEERDFVVDYRNVFGMAPKIVTGVALMVDTDNTGSSATAWFDGIDLVASGSPLGRETVP